MNRDEVAHYRLGWGAAGRGSDLDAAEARYLRRYGHDRNLLEAWSQGWEDRAGGERKRF